MQSTNKMVVIGLAGFALFVVAGIGLRQAATRRIVTSHSGLSSLGCSRRGLVVRYSGAENATLIERHGATIREIPLPANADEIACSPNGDLIAYSGYDSHGYSHITVFSLANRTMRQVTSGDHFDMAPAFSEDGRHLIFVRALSHGAAIPLVDMDVYTVGCDGSGKKRLSTEHFISIGRLAFSPDQDHILFSSIKMSDTDYSDKLFEIDTRVPSSCRLVTTPRLDIDPHLFEAASQHAFVIAGNTAKGLWYGLYAVDTSNGSATTLGMNQVSAVMVSRGNNPAVVVIKEDGSLWYRRLSNPLWQKVFISPKAVPFAYTPSKSGKPLPAMVTDFCP